MSRYSTEYFSHENTKFTLVNLDASWHHQDDNIELSFYDNQTFIKPLVMAELTEVLKCN